MLIDKMEYTHNYTRSESKNKEWIHVKEIITSPCCRLEMKYDHCRNRVYFRRFDKRNLMIEVHRCPGCGRQHSILPDFLAANKRYELDAICWIVKNPAVETRAVRSTKQRLTHWLVWFLSLVEINLDGFESIGVSECTKEALSARLSAASRDGKWLFQENKDRGEVLTAMLPNQI